MKISNRVVMIIACQFLTTPLLAAEDDSKAFEQFQEALQGYDQQSFEVIKAFLDETDLKNRIYMHEDIAPDAREIFEGQFWESIETSVMGTIPPQGSKIKAELIQFVFEDGQGRACIRFGFPGYEFRYHVLQLRHDRRGRLKIIDWFDSTIGQSFTERMSDELTTVKPTKEGTRKLLALQGPTDLQLFQVTEILKATRDSQPTRFFEIYDEFDEALKRDPLIAKRAVIMAFAIEDMDRFLDALKVFVEVYSEDPDLALLTSNFHMAAKDYEQAYTSLHRFYQNFETKDGALPAKLSALALATGKPESAEKFAIEATVKEPGLELGWWSLLRARAGADDFAGAIDALTHLEDDFGHRLDEAKLRRDKYRAFARLAQSEEFKAWRVGR